MFFKNAFLCTVFLWFATAIFAQQQSQQAHQHMHMDQTANPASDFLMSEGAGTAVNPAASPMGMSMRKAGGWSLMSHGYVFLNFIQQSGSRGDDDVFSTNHLMLMAERQPDSKSSFLLRAMLSLEPGTIQNGKYPLLFQTGETAEGQPIVDGQHPHDLFMEISAQYAVQLNPDTLLHFYGALRGDPALGPVAYPHRVSAQELPQATLSHHLQDSTHIADDVLTAGLKYKVVRFEFSGFHGAEPDDERWDLDQGAIDSWSTRFTYTPTRNWAAQISTGKLKNPEETEPGDVQRTTASVSFNQPRPDGIWASSLIWGWNHKAEEDLNLHSYLFETLWQFRHQNSISARLEIVDKDELFANDPEVQDQLDQTGGRVFRIKALTLGYARDFKLIPRLQTGIGANVSFYSTPSALEPFYGNHPKGILIYFRIRHGAHGGH